MSSSGPRTTQTTDTPAAELAIILRWSLTFRISSFLFCRKSNKGSYSVLSSETRT